MAAPGDNKSGRQAIGGRLEAARQRSFVGREAELEKFRTVLSGAAGSPTVLYLHGPGGVGKTALLFRYADLATKAGRTVLRVDGRDVESTPAGFLAALGSALGTADDPVAMLAGGDGCVLLVDTYESLAPLDRWFREDLLPRLPESIAVVLAGRYPPAADWRADPGWRDVAGVVALRDLGPDEAKAYLSSAGVPGGLQEDILRFTHGHPLALALVADVVAQGGDPLLNPGPAPDLVQALLPRFVERVPTPLHRQALQVCAEARATTEAVLRAAIDGATTSELFAWLGGLSFVETGPLGLFPHDLARDVLIADLKWRDPQTRTGLQGRIRADAIARLHAAPPGRRRQDAVLDYLYTWRADAVHRYYMQWETLGQAFGERATSADRSMIVAMVRRHEGPAAAALAAHWFDLQPMAFTVYRYGGRPSGVLAWLSLDQAAPEDRDADPGTRAAWRFAAPRVRHGQHVTMLRFFLDGDVYQRVSQACNVAAVQATLHPLDHPQLAWDFLVTADPGFWAPMWSFLGYDRLPEGDFTVDGRSFALFGHDWRAEAPAKWHELLGHRADDLPGADAVAAHPDPRPPLAETEFATAVREALRNLRRPDLLAGNPLLGSRSVRQRSIGRPAVSALVEAIEEAVDVLRQHPRDERLYRVIDRTYLRPARTQELAAEVLGLPSSTYRRHLTQAVARIVAWLWRLETHATGAAER